MRFKDYCLLVLLGSMVALGVAAFQNTPGYMDAEYYYAGGLRLAQGQGFTEMFVWNYLGLPTNDQARLPQPSHSYWMPFTSILTALGMWLTGRQHFWAGKLGFLALSAVIPALVSALSFTFSRERRQAWLAGLISVFSVFYLPYMVTTDAFSPTMFFGALFWLLLGIQRQRKIWRQVVSPLGMGLLAGALHLCRADGILWLLIAGLVVVMPGGQGQFREELSPRIQRAAWCGLGYLTVMGAWLLRNLNVFGTFLSPGGSRLLWMTDYNELFSYPASLLTLQRWWKSGLDILFDRAWAFGLNLQTAVAVQGEVFLLPLILVGLWKYRPDIRVRLGIKAWLLIFGVMTFVFPYAGARGSFFHSGAVFQPLFWAIAPVGLEAFLLWGNNKRGWNLIQARHVFQAALVSLAVVLSGFLVTSRVVGKQFLQPDWDQGQYKYVFLEQRLVDLGAQPGDVVMVNNPPGFYLASQRPSIVIPFGNLPTLISIGQRYHARYLFVELEQIEGEKLYSLPGDRPGLRYLQNFEDVQIYQFEGTTP